MGQTVAEIWRFFEFSRWRPPPCWMDQDGTWHGGRLSPGDFVLDGTQPPHQKGGRDPSPIFGPCLLWPNGLMDQDGTWHGGGPWSRPQCARWGTSSPPPKGDRAPPKMAADFSPYCCHCRLRDKYSPLPVLGAGQVSFNVRTSRSALRHLTLVS